MKIAYLLQVRDDIQQAGHTIEALATYDDVYVSFSNEKTKEKLKVIFNHNPNVHFTNENYLTIHGDLSRTRTWLLQLVQAIEKQTYLAYINVDEFSLPITTHDKLMNYINENPNTDFIETISEENVSGLRVLMENYTIATNDIRFETNEKFRNRYIKLGYFLRKLNLKKKTIPFKLYQGPCWFVLCHSTAQKIVENMYECSENFCHSAYSEEVYFGSIIQKYSTNVINKCLTYLSPKFTHAQDSSIVAKTDFENINEDHYFVNKANREDYPELYDMYIKQY